LESYFSIWKNDLSYVEVEDLGRVVAGTGQPYARPAPIPPIREREQELDSQSKRERVHALYG
jgi:hypothetical protein